MFAPFHVKWRANGKQRSPKFSLGVAFTALCSVSPVCIVSMVFFVLIGENNDSHDAT